VLKPYQRDQVNYIVHAFEFVRGMPKIGFDVTSATKNFSISLMQQISVPFLFAMNIFALENSRNKIDSAIVVFWAELDGFVRDLFATKQHLSAVDGLQARGKRLLATGKAIIPNVTDKAPHNIHHALEYLAVDLPVFVLGACARTQFSICAEQLVAFISPLPPFTAGVMSDTAEEHKHQPYKNGAHFTFGPKSCDQLVERDILVSTLRYLIHGGTFGPDGRHQLPTELRRAKDPTDSEALHPVLQATTRYPLTTSPAKPSKFDYERGRKVTVTLSPADRELIADLLGVAPAEVVEVATPCRRYTLDDTTNFEVGDVVSHFEGAEERSAVCLLALSRSFGSPVSDFPFCISAQ